MRVLPARRGKPYIYGKLKARCGESIAEVLTALLISSAGLLLLVSMLSAAARTVAASRDFFADYIEAENILSEQHSSESYSSEWSGLAGPPKVETFRGTVTAYYSADEFSSSDFSLTDSSEKSEVSGKYDVQVTYYKSTALENKPILSYSPD